MLGRPAESIPADPALLARWLKAVAPEAAGISKGRWNNVRSLFRAALALTRPMLPGRQEQPLSMSWQALYDQLNSIHRQRRLSRLLRWLSGRGIEPLSVTLAHGDEFVTVLKEETLLKDPEATWRDIVWAWNRCREEVPGWPDVTFTFASRRQTYGLPWMAFPASLKDDVDAYLNRLAGDDLTEDLPFRPVRPKTRELRERQLRTFASALVQRGRDAATIRGLADIVTIDAFKDGLRFFLERRGGTSRGIEELASTLKIVAKHWVKADQTTLDSMTAIIRNRLSVKRRGMTAKNRERLRPLDDPAMQLALVRLPQELMRRAESGKLRPQRAALQAQIAVAIEILLMAPMRMRNLIGLDLDRHLVRPALTRGVLHIVIPREEVKNSEELDYPLPEESASLIGRYLEKHRPLLASAENRALFPGPGGGAKSEHTLSSQITLEITRNIQTAHARTAEVSQSIDAVADNAKETNSTAQNVFRSSHELARQAESMRAIADNFLVCLQSGGATLQWGPAWFTGKAVIDADHKMLVQYVCELNHAMLDGKGRDVMAEVLGKLVQYTRDHFAREEIIWSNGGLKSLVEYQQKHADLVTKVEAFQREFAAGTATLSADIMSFLREWLIGHVFKTDKAGVREISGQAGQTATAA